jgi:hypothetical protein
MTRGIAFWAAGIGLVATIVNLVRIWRWETWAVEMATGASAATALVLFLAFVGTGRIDLPRIPPRPTDPRARKRQRRAWSIGALVTGLAAAGCLAASGQGPAFRLLAFVLIVLTALNAWRASTLREEEPGRV